MEGGRSQAGEEPVNSAEVQVERDKQRLSTWDHLPSCGGSSQPLLLLSRPPRPGATRTSLVIASGQPCFKAEDPGLASCSQSCYCCHLRESSYRQDKRRGNPLKALVDVVREVKTALPGRMLSFLSQALRMFVFMCTPRTPLDWGPVYPWDLESKQWYTSLPPTPLSILTSFPFLHAFLYKANSGKKRAFDS